MPDRPDFVRQQFAFAAHIRNPVKNPCPPGIEARRMNIYCELFYNNVQDLIANTYPVLRQIMSDEQWHGLIRDYYEHHISHTPLFTEIPREFLKYLEHERQPQPADPPFLVELAHYEWVELALSIADENPAGAETDSGGDPLNGMPVMSPMAWLLNYAFPVHKISAAFQPETAGASKTHLLVYRDAGFDVRFIEINAMTARLIELILENHRQPRRKGLSILQQIAAEMHHPQPDIVIQGGVRILEDLRARGVISCPR